MAIFKKDKSKDNSFKDFQKISGGNLFETDTKLKVQEEINKQNLSTITNNKKLVGKLKLKLKNYQIQDFYLLQLQANYFANTIKYTTKNYDLKRVLPLVIRLAFIDGMSGIYYDKLNDKVIPIYLGKVEYDSLGDIKEIKYIEGYNVTFTYDWLRNDNKVLKTLRGKECENVAIFKWGEAAISCWMIIWKFVQFQNQLLRMLNSSSFLLSKKFIYKVENQFSMDQEMDLFFDPDIPFLKVNKSMDLNNKMEIQDNANNIDTEKIIEYYKGVLSIYYALIGRKINQDAKRERNLAQEVQTNTENFTILERDWLIQFELFCDKLAIINPKLKVEPYFTLENEMKLQSMNENPYYENENFNNEKPDKKEEE